MRLPMVGPAAVTKKNGGQAHAQTQTSLHLHIMLIRRGRASMYVQKRGEIYPSPIILFPPKRGKKESLERAELELRL